MTVLCNANEEKVVSIDINKPHDYIVHDTRKAQYVGDGMTEDEPSTELAAKENAIAIIEDAKEDAKDDTSTEVYFYVFGCAGNGKETQKQVAKLMNDIALKKQKKPKFMIILGDNFYDCGVDSPRDEAFNSNFYGKGLYQDPKLTEIAGIPCFVIPGNHDHNLHHPPRGKTEGNIDFKKIAAQIEHTYLSADKSTISPDKVLMFNGADIDLGVMGAFNMPSRFYSGTLEGKKPKKNPDGSGAPGAPEHDLKMFFVDSSTYVRDYLRSIKYPDFNTPDNQANWLARSVKESGNALKILSMHHARFTVDKRALKSKSDAHYYLSDFELGELAKLGFTGNYNEILNKIMQKQGLKFDAVFSAHTHAMAYHVNNKEGEELCQVVSGGGGGNLEYRRVFKNRELVPCFIKDHGFVAVTADLSDPEKKLELDFHSVGGQHLKFHNKNPIPIRQEAKEAEGVLRLRKVMNRGCDLYLDSIAGETRGSRDSTLADDFLAYFKRFEPLTFDEAVQRIVNVKKLQPDDNEKALATHVNYAMRELFGVSYKEFFENPTSILEDRPPIDLEEEAMNLALEQGSFIKMRSLSLHAST